MRTLLGATEPGRRALFARVAPLAVSAFFLVIYGARIDPWVGAGDTAKFQLIGATLGTPHAPGYPTYVLLLHLMSRLLPQLTWAASADLFSALCMAATVGLAVLLAQELGARPPAAVAAAVAFGSLEAVRAIASSAEVYPFHLLLVAGALLALLRWRRDGRLRQLVCGGALLSLAFSHHSTIVCSLPAALLLAASRRPPLRRLLAWMPVFLLLALAPFAYIVWRSYAPPTSHLEMQALSAAQLWDGMSGAQHRANLLQVGIAGILTERLPWLGGQLLHQYGWLLALGALGLLAGSGWHDRVFIALLAAGNAAFTLVYTVPDVDIYLLPAHLALALAVSLGAQWLGDRIPRGLATLLYLLVAISPALASPGQPPSLHAVWAREMAATVDAVPAGAVLVSFDYPTSMALTYEAWERHGGVPRVLAVPEVALRVPLAIDRLRRHLAGGTPLRAGPRDELLAPRTPLLCRCPAPSTREALGRQGILTVTAGAGLYRLQSIPGPPPLPAAILASRLVRVTSLRKAIAALEDPAFAPARDALRLGKEGEVRRPRGGSAMLRLVSPDAVIVDVTSPGGGWLVLTDLYASRWTVTVDGRPSGSFRADVLFLGLAVPGGTHRVEVRRDRRPFALARWLRSPWGYLLP
ncbi:MAG TPA: DUF2723 domain-containing protein [Thermoanaerobaculia bacterium]|jgi:hypothetical protein